MKLVVGLGNPEKKYENTRHNVGFILIDALVREKGLSWGVSAKINHAVVAKNNDTIYLKPQDYMNESGIAVAKALNFYNLNTEDVIVVNDDLDLAFGVIKKQFDASSAGHNGVESVIEHLGTQKFWRVRIGIGRPEAKMAVINYVLSSFSDAELVAIQKIDLASYL